MDVLVQIRLQFLEAGKQRTVGAAGVRGQRVVRGDGAHAIQGPAG